jgi:hypothetical protein
MKKYILDFICQLEGFKTGIKSLHWDANSLSQHQLCDDIATIISDYQDKVSEVEQSISGKLPVNILKGTQYKITTLKKFVEDVISATNSFYSKLKKEGDKYIGMRSDTEAVLSDLQRQLYLVDFTIKEDLKKRLRNQINENRVEVSNGKEMYSMTENELREIVSEAINNIKSRVDEHSLDKNSARRELDLYIESLKDFGAKTHRVCGLMMETGYRRAANFLAAILREINATIKYVENEEVINVNDVNESKKNTIHIKPENKGKFTATKKATGKSTEELTHSKNPLTRKRANFAKMAKRGWKPLNEIERSFPNSIPGDDDVYYPGDINPDVWDALQRGDYGEDNYDPTEEDPEAFMNYDDHDPSDNELYNYGRW